MKPEPVRAKFLKLRYALIPYIHALGRQTYASGAPFMHALFIDFPNDPHVADMGDESMFGPAILVAPVTEQGATSRKVWLPAGADWYDSWTERRFTRGQTIDVAAPIDQIPLCVRAGSIVPIGVQIPVPPHGNRWKAFASIRAATPASRGTMTTASATPTAPAAAARRCCAGTTPPAG